MGGLWLYDLIETMIISLVIAHGIASTLDLRHGWLLYVALPIGNAAVQVFGYYVFRLDFVAVCALSLALNVVLPLVLNRGSVAKGLAVVALAALCETATASMQEGFLALVTASPIPEDWQEYLAFCASHAVAWSVTEVLQALALLALLLCVRTVLRRRDQRSGGVTWIFAALLVSQFLLALLLGVVAAVADMSPSWGMACSLIVGLFLVADLLVLFMLESYERQRREEADVRDLEQAIESYSEEYAQIVDEIRSFAHVRHDVLNELNVAAALARRGETERARELVSDLALRCEEGSR